MNIFGKIRSWNNVRQTRNELNNLSAHQLNDIGIVPGNITTVARNAVR